LAAEPKITLHDRGDFADVRAPIIVGVTGHRDIPEEAKPAIAEKIRAVLLQKMALYPRTPFVLLSALAEGADQLAAQVALSAEVHIPLYAVLPMPSESYEQDFQGEALTTFHGLIEDATNVVELPLVPGNTIASIAHQGHERDLQYESVGKYIVERCEILIALWDGTDNGLIAGTAAVVRFQREGIASPDSCNIEPPEGFPVCHILTPRKSNPNPAGEPVRWLYPSAFGDEDDPHEYYHRIFSHIEKFNSFVAKPSGELRTGAARSRKYLLGENSETKLFESCERELNFYSMADALALKFQHDRNKTQWLLHGTVWAAFVALVLFSHTPHHHTEYLVVAFIVFITAYLIHRVARKDERDSNYQDYRALAEGLRVELFWRAAGLHDFVESYYLWKQRSELDWIRSVFRGWNIRKRVDASAQRPAPLPQLEQVRKCWVEDQLKYFQRAAGREEQRQERTENVGNIMVLTAIILGAALLISLWAADYYLRGRRYDPHESIFVNLVLIFVEALLAGGAILHHYADRMAYAAHSKQYSRMALVFSRASRNIQALIAKGDAAGAVQCFRKLGREALTENGDWVQLHRERPLEMPHP
jgi:hypothetical protein